MKSWNDPSPYGPSRRIVSGTSPQPSASERCQAASSRLNRPRGKSHSGRSPRSGLYTASALAPSSATSVRNVAFELHGIRPFSVTSPRVRRSAVSVVDVTVAPRARVTGRIPGLVAPRADGSAGLHERVRLLDERRRLRAVDQEARGGRLALGVLLHRLVGDDQDAVARFVIAHGDRRDGPGRVDRLDQREVGGRRRAAAGQAVQERAEVLRERPDLLLLALERDELALLAPLEIEDSLARLADGAGGEVIGAQELERGAHDPVSRPRSPSIEFTVSTTGPSRWYPITVIEHGAIITRWKRSRWMPRAWATAALIGSAWDTTTTAAPGWRATIRASAEVTRVCISVNDSPPGNRNPLGWRCTICHSGLRASRLSFWPVQSPTSQSARSRSTRTARWRARAIGIAVSRARSRFDAYTAATLGSLPIRAAAASACCRPLSARCRPGAWPGRTTPVVGVWP